MTLLLEDYFFYLLFKTTFCHFKVLLTLLVIVKVAVCDKKVCIYKLVNVQWLCDLLRLVVEVECVEHVELVDFNLPDGAAY